MGSTRFDNMHDFAPGDMRFIKDSVWALRVTGWFVVWVLAKDVLRLDKINIVATSANTIPMEKEELPVESLINLAVFKDSSMSQKRVSQWDLRGSELKPNKVIAQLGNYDNFDRALNLNAGNLELRVPFDNFAAISGRIVLKSSGLVSERTKNVHVRYILSSGFPDVDEFPHEYFRQLADNIKKRTKLEGLFILVTTPYLPDAIFESFAKQTTDLNTKLLQEKYRCIRGCKLIVAIVSYFPVQTLNNAIDSEHDVTKIGKLCNNYLVTPGGTVMISREVKLHRGNYTIRFTFVGT